MQVKCQYALKQNFMKTEFENSIRRLRFLCRLPDQRFDIDHVTEKVVCKIFQIVKIQIFKILHYSSLY